MVALTAEQLVAWIRSKYPDVTAFCVTKPYASPNFPATKAISTVVLDYPGSFGSISFQQEDNRPERWTGFNSMAFSGEEGVLSHFEFEREMHSEWRERGYPKDPPVFTIQWFHDFYGEKASIVTL